MKHMVGFGAPVEEQVSSLFYYLLYIHITERYKAHAMDLAVCVDIFFFSSIYIYLPLSD